MLLVVIILMNNNFKSGFVALIGRPNAGKSTFINRVLGQKVSIISNKPQTTRNTINGIYTTEDTQIIFIDTPGIHKPHHELGSVMNKMALNTIKDVDLILYIIDGTEKYGRGDAFVIDELSKTKTPKILLINKIDLINDKNKLLENVVNFTQNVQFDDVYYISALNGENVDKLLQSMTAHLDFGPMYYPKEQISDHPETFIISEIIREKVLQKTTEEVPHSVAVAIEEMKPLEDNPNTLSIRAIIYVERASQKKIIIGAGGKMIKDIGTLARKDIVMLLGQKIYLDLWVKVEDDWRNRIGQLRKLGYFLEK